MKKIGFLISEKENETRRAIVLEHINRVKNKECLYFQEGYGKVIGFSDNDIITLGCKVVTKKEILDCDIICDPKIGDSELLKEIKGKTVFGWIHATQNYDITQTCIDNGLTVYAWEKMYDKERHIFSENNRIAGEAAILHAMITCGKTFFNMKAAVLGDGNTSKGAQKILKAFDVDTTVYSRKKEEEFKKHIQEYDIIVNCILWDVTRKDHIIYKKDLKKLKTDATIIDVSCDKNGGIETSIPTTVENPVYVVEGITHYVVDHTPTLLHKQATYSISEQITKFLDDLIENKNNKILADSLIIDKGKIVDSEIIEFQNRK